MTRVVKILHVPPTQHMLVVGMKSLLLLSFLLPLICCSSSSRRFPRGKAEETNFGCLDGNGRFVDWWFIYKASDGLSYVYLDSSLKEALPVHLECFYFDFNFCLAF